MSLETDAGTMKENEEIDERGLIEVAREFRQIVGEVRSRDNPHRVVDYWNVLSDIQREYILERREYNYVFNARWVKRLKPELKGFKNTRV